MSNIRITDKEHMYRLLRAGVFGNTLACFTPDKLHMFDAMPEFAIRSKRINGELRIPIQRAELITQIHSYCADNKCTFDDILVYETDTPGGVHTFTAEVAIIAPIGLVVEWSTHDARYRHALEHTSKRTDTGVIAYTILRKYLDPADFDWIMQLLDTYDAVIELACFERPIGMLQKRMVVWEVRSY